jgi:hypothetical protein
MKVNNELDQLTLDCENVKEEIGETEKKVGGLNKQPNYLRDVCLRPSLCSLVVIDMILCIGCLLNGQQSRSRSVGARSCACQNKCAGQWDACQVEITSLTIRVAFCYSVLGVIFRWF